MRRLIRHLILVPLLVSLGCSDRKAIEQEHVRWDPISSIYSLPQRNLSYEVQSDRSIVASKDLLPEKVCMCVVDTQNSVSVLLFDIVEFPPNKELSNKLINEIIRQDDNVPMSVRNIVYQSCQFLNYDAWHFNAVIDISSDETKLPVTYNGYIFDRNVLVVTAFGDSLSDDFFRPYINSLKRLD